MTRAGVIGSPISHSLSPVLHRAAYQALGLDWTYESADVDVEQLPGFVAGLDDSWVGLSLTMPLKEAVLGLADEIDDIARATTSANTFLLASRTAVNTDVDGIRVALQRGGFDVSPGFSATVVGAGATARSAVAAASELGAGHLRIMARRPQAAGEAVKTADRLGLPVTVHGIGDAEALSSDLVISTVPAGAADQLLPLLPEHPRWLLDVVYAPWPTQVAGAWQVAGGRIVSGLEMLLAQAERQVELMTGLPAPTEAMRAALEAKHAQG